MLPGEYAVEIDTLNCGRVSLFAWAEKVRDADALLNVEVLDCSQPDTLVRLPSQPFEIPSRCVRVAQDQLIAL